MDTPQLPKDPNSPSSNVQTAQAILSQAHELIAGARQAEYGPPQDNFVRIGTFWTDYLHMLGLLKSGARIKANEVAIMLNLLKVARLAGGKPSDDTYTDAAAYIALAAELDEKL